jgi:hypothetical protein
VLRGAVALTLALCSLSGAARAQHVGPLVVVITSNPETPFVRRLAAELGLFGYRVEVATRASSDVDWGELLGDSGGAALIAVDAGGQTAEIVIGDQAGGPPRRERERLDPRRRADTNAAVLAERFRARLTELGIAPSAEPQPAPPIAVVQLAPTPPAAESERRLWLAAAFGGTSGGLGVQPDIQLELRAFPVSFLSTGAFAKWSPLAADVDAREGEADVRLLSGGVLIDAYPLRGPDFSANLGVGVMLVSASMTGRAAAPWGGRTDSVLVPAGMFESGIAYRLSPRVSAELRGFVGACSPRIAVRFAGRNVADFGQPLFGASFGVAVGVF